MTDKLIYDTAIADGMPVNMANLITAQSKHETANYTSNAFLKNNNGFGYKFVRGAKWQSGAGITSTENDPYARYATIENSVHEIIAWIRRRQNEGHFPAELSDIDKIQYATLLKNCGYFGDPISNYLSGLNHYYKDFSLA